MFYGNNDVPEPLSVIYTIISWRDNYGKKNRRIRNSN